MRSSGRDGQGRAGGKGPRLRPYLPLLLALILLAPFHSASAAAQIVSGSTQQLGNITPHGSTSYVVDYTYPSTAQVGTNLTISLTLHVGEFTGYIEYTTSYELQVELFVGAQQQQVTLYGPVGLNVSTYLYPGGIWGPNNATFPLTEADTGLAIGQSANATFSVTLLDYVELGPPFSYFQTEPPMDGQGGSLLVENGMTSSTSSSSIAGESTGQSPLHYVLLASGAVLIAAAIFMPRRTRSPPPNQK